MFTPHQTELYQRIQTFPLDYPGAQLSFSQRLARDNCWTSDYTKRVIEEYKKFAFLAISSLDFNQLNYSHDSPSRYSSSSSSGSYSSNRYSSSSSSSYSSSRSYRISWSGSSNDSDDGGTDSDGDGDADGGCGGCGGCGCGD